LAALLAALGQQIPQPEPRHREHQRREAQQHAAREVVMLEARIDIEAFGLAGDRLGDDLPLIEIDDEYIKLSKRGRVRSPSRGP
jgi:hypothetical protein